MFFRWTMTDKVEEACALELVDFLPRIFLIAERNLDMVQVDRGSQAGENVSHLELVVFKLFFKLFFSSHSLQILKYSGLPNIYCYL